MKSSTTVLVLFVFAGVLCSLSTVQVSAAVGCEEIVNYKIVDAPEIRHLTVGSFAECCGACEYAAPECKAFSYDSYDGRCTLYSEVGRRAYWYGHSCGYPGTSST